MTDSNATCPECGRATLDWLPEPQQGKVYCRDTVGCGYWRKITAPSCPSCNIKNATIAVLVGALEKRTPDNPYDSGGTCSFCGSYDDHYNCCSWQAAHDLLADLDASALEYAARYEQMEKALQRTLQNGVQHYQDDTGKCFRTCTGCPTERMVRAALGEELGRRGGKTMSRGGSPTGVKPPPRTQREI